jgi:hypothetical protein
MDPALFSFLVFLRSVCVFYSFRVGDKSVTTTKRGLVPDIPQYTQLFFRLCVYFPHQQLRRTYWYVRRITPFMQCTVAEFLDNSSKSLKSFPPCYSESPLRLQLCIEISISSNYSFYSALVYTVKEKGGKPDRKPHPLPYVLRNPYRNLKSENSQDNAEKPQRNCTFMNSMQTM